MSELTPANDNTPPPADNAPPPGGEAGVDSGPPPDVETPVEGVAASDNNTSSAGAEGDTSVTTAEAGVDRGPPPVANDNVAVNEPANDNVAADLSANGNLEVGEPANENVDKAEVEAGADTLGDPANDNVDKADVEAGADALGDPANDNVDKAEVEAGADALGDPANDNVDKADRVGDLMQGYKRYGDLTPDQFYNTWYDPTARGGEGDWAWPKDGGAEGTQFPALLKPGLVLDRCGDTNGKYFSADGTPYAQRALPTTSIPEPGTGVGYDRYFVTKPLQATASWSAPSFEQPGGSLQFRTDQTADWLLANGYLQRIP